MQLYAIQWWHQPLTPHAVLDAFTNLISVHFQKEYSTMLAIKHHRYM